MIGCTHAPESIGRPRSPQSDSQFRAPSSQKIDSHRNIKEVDHEKRHRADLLISVFENASTEIRYDYIENLGDGRGFTAGRAGFCSGTGDLLIVVERYASRSNDKSLTKFLPRLRVLAKQESSSTAGLKGFITAWKTASKNPLMHQIQDEVLDELYFAPALRHADQIHASLALTWVALYEAIIQHGDDDDDDSLSAIMARATARANGSPADGLAEEKWLEAFLEERRADLLDPSDSSTRKEWRASVGRADTMLKIFHDENFEFNGPLVVNPFGTPFELP